VIVDVDIDVNVNLNATVDVDGSRRRWRSRSGSRRRQGQRLACAAIAFLLCLGTAHADNVTVGLYAPTAPFPSTAARVDFASKLGTELGTAIGGTGSGKVFARAGDFAAAVKSGDVTIALVDATYLAAAGGNYTVLAGAVRGGDIQHGWQLVARNADKISALRGKRVLVPAIDGREVEFVVDVMFGGEINKDYFSKIEPAPDTASALAALGLGKADAAIVPAGVELPAGTSVVLTLPVLSGPVLVVYGNPSAQRKTQLAAAAAAYHGDATVGGFRATDAEGIHAIARRFAPVVKRGPLAVPAIRLLVGDLVEGRTLAIERSSPTVFVASPKP
jgi:hypothetical protein